jgi:hypothetical protein
MTAPTPPELPPNVRLFELVASIVPAKALGVVAELGVADHLGDQPMPVDALAAATGTNPGALYRILRLLASIGIFTEVDGRRFGHTDLSRALRSDDPAKARAAVRMMAGTWMWKGFGAMDTSVTTGDTGWASAIGEPIFDWLSHQPAEAVLFNEAMIGIHGGEVPAVAAAYPFTGTVIDVGGGVGNMIAQVLTAHPGTRGVVFDLPHTMDGAQRRLAAAGLGDRASFEAGSFFERVPAGGDAYILSHIIHDWDEDRAVAILDHCRAAKNPGGKVLIVEMVVTPPNVPHPAKMLDIVMLTIPGGRERTADEYGELLTKAGLRLTRVIPTMSPVSIIEAE